MNLPLLIYICLFLSPERKFTHVEILASRHFPTWVLARDCPILEEQRLYKLQLNLNAIRFILQPLMCGGMMYFSIFGGGVITNLCLVSFCTSQIYIHVSKFVVHLRIWTSINAMCRKNWFTFSNSFQWTCLTRLKRLQWQVYPFCIVQIQCLL
jgi:hypothetical protein